MRLFSIALSLIVLLTALAPAARANTTWESVYQDPGQKNSVILMAAVDGEHAWAIGIKDNSGNSEIVGLRTTTGTGWSTMTLPQGGSMFPIIFTAMAFVDDNNGVVVGSQMEGLSMVTRVHLTTDGGASWTQAAQLGGDITGLQVLRGQYYGVGGGDSDALFFHSADGQTWTETPVTTPSADVKPEGISMLNDTCGWLVGGHASSDTHPTADNGAVWYTGDSGQTWTVLAEGLPQYLRRASFATGNEGWAVGNHGQRGVILHTCDGGETWAPQTVPDHPARPDVCLMSVCLTDPTPVTGMTDIRFWDADRGIAQGLACTGECEGDDPSYLSVFLRTFDGGASWELDEHFEDAMPDATIGPMTIPGEMSGLHAMAFGDPNHGFLGGQHLMILRYDADWIEDPAQFPPACDSVSESCSQSPTDGGIGPRPDGGTDGDNALTGCGCRTGPPSSPLLLLLALALWWRRRRVRP